jgi:Zn-dependent protease
MKSWSISVARILGVELRLHFTFLLLIVFISFFAMDTPGGAGVVRGLGLMAVVLVAVVLHETGHIIAAQVRRIPLRAIVLLPIGGLPFRDGTEAHRAPVAKDEVLFALAGPLTSLLAGAIAAAAVFTLKPDVHLLVKPYISAEHILKSVVWVNLLLGAINLAPVYPLDGGRLLRLLLMNDRGGRGDYRAATRRVVSMGQVFATFLIFAGMWNPWLMLVGFFLFVAVQIEDRTLVFQSVIEGVRLEEVMLTHFSTLSPADTLEDALAKAVHTLQDDFPVIRGGDMVGVISKNSIVKALREQGNGYVQSAMRKAFEVGARNESLAAAFRKIAAHGATIIPVVEENRLVGIVTLQNLMHSMGLLAESKRLQREIE